ncbi:uncharacterized protein LOC128752530 [Synchiropus splendidus]|uniref:uncharacterized protein LOC128752530 n=1 Tax=Synchiropus splendidus TaxID=270530 RepID=UPI00237EB147|nr:uncharacterized protein LOC128752530 [Synchiropus splendidus]
MASIVGSAPLERLHAGDQALVEDPQFQAQVGNSRSLTEKLIEAVKEAHKSCVDTETFQLGQEDVDNLAIVARNINMPTPPVLRVSAENVSVESGLTQVTEGLLLYQAMLNATYPKLQKNEQVVALIADIKDLVVQLNKMLKMANAAKSVQPTPAPVELRLDSEYRVQVAIHLTLVHLQSFGHDMSRWLRQLDQSEEEEET